MALVEALCRHNDVFIIERPMHFRKADPCFNVFAYGHDCLTQLAAEPGGIAASSYKLTSMADIMAYLRLFIDYDPEGYERGEIARIAAAINEPCSSTEGANAAICEHARQVAPDSAKPLLAFLLWRAQREQAIMRTSLGPGKENRTRYA
jgi:hypothetical protein